MRALRDAYRASGLDSPSEGAPFALRDYVVEIYMRELKTEISFVPLFGGTPVYTVVRNGEAAIADPSGDDGGSPATLIPGAVAGEILAVLDHAKAEGHLFETPWFQNDRYHLNVVLVDKGSLVAFFPSSNVATEPPGTKCLSGACDGVLVYRFAFAGRTFRVTARPRV